MKVFRHCNGMLFFKSNRVNHIIKEISRSRDSKWRNQKGQLADLIKMSSLLKFRRRCKIKKVTSRKWQTPAEATGNAICYMFLMLFFLWLFSKKLYIKYTHYIYTCIHYPGTCIIKDLLGKTSGYFYFLE